MLKVERVEGVDGGVRHLTDRMMDKINRYLIEFKAEIYASSMNGLHVMRRASKLRRFRHDRAKLTSTSVAGADGPTLMPFANRSQSR